MGQPHDEDARRAFATALSQLPERGAWWFDLGRFHMWRARYVEALDCFLRARARLGEAACRWNIAVCATGSGDGDLAGGMWRELGFDVALNESSGLPQVSGLKPLQVRVPAKSPTTSATPGERRFEVLAVQPFSPCHGVITTPSFEDAPVDYGDVVLFDGERVTHEVPVVPVLSVLVPGREHRMRFVATASAADLQSLRDALGVDAQFFAYADGGLTYGKLVSNAELRTLGDAWQSAVRKTKIRIAIPELFEQLGMTRRAGQEHQAWRAIQRKATSASRSPSRGS